VAEMLGVAAFEVGDPVALGVLMESNDFSGEHFCENYLMDSWQEKEFGVWCRRVHPKMGKRDFGRIPEKLPASIH
jgi:hypothetical protein